MPIISAELVERFIYRITMNTGYGCLENMIVSKDGLYSVYFIKDGICINKTGKILNIVQNRAMPKNSYILFDWSDDQANHRERIHFYKIQNIIDVTPNDAYMIAVEHGFVGTVDDWLESLKGNPGKSAYETAVDCGFVGTEEEWLASLQGGPGLSAYDIAVKAGFTGTEEEWLASLKGDNGDSAYELAVKHGYVGTEEEWLASLQGRMGVDGKSAYDLAVEKGFSGTEEEWLTSLQGAPGMNAYEIAVHDYGYTGTEEEWMAQFGDVTVVNIRVEEHETKIENIEKSITWIEGMIRE